VPFNPMMDAMQQARREIRQLNKDACDNVGEDNQALVRFAKDGGNQMIVSQQLPDQKNDFHMIPSPSPTTQSFKCHYIGKSEIREALAGSITTSSQTWMARHRMVLEKDCPDAPEPPVEKRWCCIAGMCVCAATGNADRMHFHTNLKALFTKAFGKKTSPDGEVLCNAKVVLYIHGQPLAADATEPEASKQLYCWYIPLHFFGSRWRPTFLGMQVISQGQDGVDTVRVDVREGNHAAIANWATVWEAIASLDLASTKYEAEFKTLSSAAQPDINCTCLLQHRAIPFEDAGLSCRFRVWMGSTAEAELRRARAAKRPRGGEGRHHERRGSRARNRHGHDDAARQQEREQGDPEFCSSADQFAPCACLCIALPRICLTE